MNEISAAGFPSSDGAPGGLEEASFLYTGKVPMITDPESMTAEAIRSLRTVMISQHLQGGRRSLAICSPTAGAGCTFLAANLAVAMAQVGVKTLLIDANLREPGVQQFIEPSGDIAGLSDCLRDDMLPLASVIRNLQPSLSVLYAGQPDHISQDQIGGDMFRTVISSCMRDYDLTIIDTPPANRYADARRIASVARYAMVVACRQRSYHKDIRTLITELETDHTSVIGTYLNDY